MGGRTGLGRWRRFAAVAFTLYAVFLVTAQFEHHDLACHLKTPQHCTSCNLSPLGSTPKSPVTLNTHRLMDAGRAETVQVSAESPVLAATCAGRSPPALI